MLFDQQFQIIFLSVFSLPHLPSPPLLMFVILRLFFFYSLSQDLIHSINRKARTGIKETQDTRFFWNKDQGRWHNKSHEFLPAKKEATVAAHWDSRFDYDIYNERQEGFSLRQVLSRKKKKYIYIYIYIYIYSYITYTSSSSSSCSWRVRRVSCSLILKMQLVPPSLPRSSYVLSSFRFIL